MAPGELYSYATDGRRVRAYCVRTLGRGPGVYVRPRSGYAMVKALGVPLGDGRAHTKKKKKTCVIPRDNRERALDPKNR